MSDNEIYYPKYLKLFRGREDVVAEQYEGGGYSPLRSQVLNKEILYKHLEGLITIGQYVLDVNNCSNYICIDLDTDKGSLNEYDFKDFKLKIHFLRDDLLAYVNFLIQELNLSYENMLFEDSGGRGLHLWIFFDFSISGAELKQLDYVIKQSVTPKFANYEFFPKQAVAKDLGSLIKLPLGLHRKYNRRSFFFHLKSNEFHSINGIEENLSFLANIKPISRDKVIEFVKSIKITDNQEVDKGLYQQPNDFKRVIFNGDPSELINKCQALNKLHDKALAGNVLSRQEAFGYTSSLLSLGSTDTFIKSTFKKSFGNQYREEYTTKEFEQIKTLSPISCLRLRELEICNAYCTKDIINEFKDKSIRSKIPASVFFHPKGQEVIVSKSDIKDKVTKTSNIELAFIKLKKYGKQGTLFFDDFDFQDFEENLSINCRHISELLIKDELIPIEGYRKFEYPKKIKENKNVVFRNLTYSPVMDQVVIQSVFNYVGIILDRQLSESSIGYRLDKTILSDNIFEDWKELYPIYRNKIIKSISENNATFFIYCDVEQFYDKINHKILFAQIKGSLDKFSFNITTQHVESYNYDETKKGFGLPQGPAFARVLANFYLRDFDKLCEELSIFYYRYVDDMFIFFQTEEEAKSSLERITAFLSQNLGLNFSSAEDKEIVIRETSKNRQLILDKFQQAWYLEKNEFGKLEGSSIKTIQSFYQKIDQRIQLEIKDIDDLNKELYSLIYLSSDYHDITSELRNLIQKCIPYLISKEQFFPKNAKQVFWWIFRGRLFTQQELIQIFKSIHNTHKLIFLFELNRFIKNDNHYFEAFKDIITISSTSNNNYIKGLGVAFLTQEGILNYGELNVGIEDFKDSFFIKKMPKKIESLEKIREYFNLLNYSNLGLSAKKKIIALFSINKDNTPQYSDFLHLKEITKGSSHLLLPELCELFSTLKDDGSMWNYMITTLAKENVRFKPFILSLIEENVTNTYKSETEFILLNQLELYLKIEDEEFKNSLSSLIRVLNPVESTHKRLLNFKNSDYYQTLNPNENIEVLSWSNIEGVVNYSIDDFFMHIDDLTAKEFVPPLSHTYNSINKTIKLEYSIDGRRYFPFNDMAEINQESIFTLLTELYNNSNYIFKILNRCPLISEENLFYDKLEKSLVFKTLGSIFNESYIIYDKSFDIIIPNSIPKMIGFLLRNKFFKGASNSIKYSGHELFLFYLKNRLMNDEPMSFNRLKFLCQKIASTNISSKNECIELYLFERFKGHLLMNFNNNIKWFHIIKTYMEIIDVAKKNIDFHPHAEILFPYHYSFSEMTILSKYLWKYNCLYEKIFMEFGTSNKLTFNIFQVINLFSILVIETLCLVKVISVKKSFKFEKEYKGVRYKNWLYEPDSIEWQQMSSFINATGIDDVFIRNFNLSNLWLACLICDSKITDIDSYLVLSDTRALKKSKEVIPFFELLKTIEKDIYFFSSNLANQTYSNLDFDSKINLEKCIENLKLSLLLIGKNMKSISNYKRDATSEFEYEEQVILEEYYLQIPLAKSEGLIFHKSNKNIDLYNGKIVTVIAPANNVIELWNFIYKVNIKSYIFPAFLTSIWLILSLMLAFVTKSLVYTLIISVLLLIIGIPVSKWIESQKWFQKVFKAIGLNN